jgi:hypothetical protein
MLMITERDKYRQDVEFELKDKDFVFDYLIPVGKTFSIDEYTRSSWKLKNGTLFHKKMKNAAQKRCVKTLDGAYYYLITKPE